MIISKQNAYFSSISSRTILRKSLLVIVVLIITICNIYLKNSIKRASNEFNEEYRELTNKTLPFNTDWLKSNQTNGKINDNWLKIFRSRKLQEKTFNSLNNNQNETNSTQTKT